MTNAIIRVALSGHVNVYIVTVNNGLNNSNGLSTLETVLKNRLNWNVQEVSLSQLGASDSTIKLNDPESGW